MLADFVDILAVYVIDNIQMQSKDLVVSQGVLCRIRGG